MCKYVSVTESCAASFSRNFSWRRVRSVVLFCTAVCRVVVAEM